MDQTPNYDGTHDQIEDTTEEKTLSQHDEHFLSESIKPALSRKRKNELPDIEDNLKVVLQHLCDDDSISISPKTKGNRGLHNGRSKRRSKYVGVSRNGCHWQTLINVGKTKKYIGTYCSEAEAAMVYDFYSLGLHGLKARTNFAYKGELVRRIIKTYFDNDNKFEPSRFVNEIEV